jgi:ribosome maturation factor RimP
VVDELYDALSPLLAAAGFDLFDCTVGPRTVTVTVNRPSGIDLDALAEANRLVSGVLDEHPPLTGSYTLEVSSPGLERRLRRPEHFRGAIGEQVSVRTLPGTGEHRRVHGRLSVADESGVVLSGPEVPSGELRIPYEAIDRARTVFEWPTGNGGNRKAERKRVERERATTR